MKLTMVVSEGANGFFIGKIQEIPAVLTQGRSIEEAQENLQDALALYLEDMREENATDNAVWKKDINLV
ncbi:type II toxin-antitoxin system HicB family antitoxin [Pontibacter pamirensis]|uniref:type II toxin-antitoxin system HicB family antitoxin n=1 Tax=Pontibacter pamirensis TaxID=2562824 RepID=UPI001389D43F|nr:type II toxin-antitoxin system HicB family antitoxin [Pontibacter pamirensis]